MSRKHKNRGRPGLGGGQPAQPRVEAAVARVPSSPVTLPQAAPQPPVPRPLRKDQQRALRCYEWAKAAKGGQILEDYTIAVQNFAATLLRSGLAAAVSVLERDAKRAGFKFLLDHLASYPLPGIVAATNPDSWPASVRAVADVGCYMQATRELIALLAWLRRACRALETESGG